MNSRRVQILKAMDVDVWVRRDLPIGEAAPVQASPAAEIAPQSALTTAAAIAPVIQPAGAPREAAAPALQFNAPDDRVAQMGWEELAETVRSCTLCALHSTRSQGVFGVGNRQAEWMVVGEAPGADEDRQGEPFVGRAGQLLNSMLRAIGFPRQTVYIANVLKSRPPGNRDPRPEEVVACMPYLMRQIELINPRIILCVGRIAAQNLLHTDTPIGKLRNQVHRLGPKQRPVVVTYHPAYLLRSPGEKRKAWDDLQLALRTFAAEPRPA